MEDAHGSSLTFPPELVDRTIDHLYDDKPSLRACALVSRSWLNTSRHHLFRTLLVRPRGQDTLAGQEFTVFRSFLRETPHVSFHIRELGLGTRRPYGRGVAQLCKHALSDILQRTPKLLKLWLLAISIVDCDEHCENLIYYSQAAPVDLIELSFAVEFMVVIEPFIETLRFFGHVGTLRFHPRFFGNHEAAITTMRSLSRIPMSLRVHELVNGPITDKIIYDVLIIFRSLDTLSSFFFLLPMFREESTSTVSQFIAAAGSTLRHLSLNLLFMRPGAVLPGKSSPSIKH